MNTSEKFIQLLEKANIEVIDSLKEGRIQSLEIKQDGLSAKLTIAFPKVIDVNLEKQIRLAFKDYFTSVMGFSNLTLNLEYDDNNITKEALQIYYEYIAPKEIDSFTIFIQSSSRSPKQFDGYDGFNNDKYIRKEKNKSRFRI